MKKHRGHKSGRSQPRQGAARGSTAGRSKAAKAAAQAKIPLVEKAPLVLVSKDWLWRGSVDAAVKSPGLRGTGKQGKGPPPSTARKPRSTTVASKGAAAPPTAGRALVPAVARKLVPVLAAACVASLPPPQPLLAASKWVRQLIAGHGRAERRAAAALMLPILLFAGILFATPRMMAALQQVHATLTRAPLPITGIARNAVERPPADTPIWSQTAAAHGSIFTLGRGSSHQTLPDRAPQTRPMRAASLQSFPPLRIDDSPAAQSDLPIAADAPLYTRPPERLAATVPTDAPDRTSSLAATVAGVQPYLRPPEALVQTVPVAAADLTVVAAASAPPPAPFTQPFTRPPESLLAVPSPQISGSAAALAAAASTQPAPPYVDDVPASAQQVCRASPGLVGARSGLSTIVPRRDATLSDDPARFGLALAAAAKAQTHDLVIYNPAYMTIAYPRGDVPMQFGVCTDVIIRAYRALDIDLQELVHLSKGGASDPNIDHRRTETLRRFFSAYGESRGISSYVEDYLPGDIVTYYRPQNKSSTAHIALVSDVMAPSGRPMIVHNRGWGVQLEDALFVDQMTGHYRFFGIRPLSTAPVELVATARTQPAQAVPASAALPMALGLTIGINRPVRLAGARGTITMRSAARSGMAGGRMGLGGGTPAAGRCELAGGTRSCRPGAS